MCIGVSGNNCPVSACFYYFFFILPLEVLCFHSFKKTLSSLLEQGTTGLVPRCFKLVHGIGGYCRLDGYRFLSPAGPGENN